MQDVDQEQKSIGSGLMKSYKQLTEEIIQEADVSTGGQKFRANLFNPINQLGRGIRKSAGAAARFAGSEALKAPGRAFRGLGSISSKNPMLGTALKGAGLIGLMAGGYYAKKQLERLQDAGQNIKDKGGFF